QMGSAVFASDAFTLRRDLDCAEYRQASTLERELAKRTGCSVDSYNFAIGGEMVSDAYMIAHSLFAGKHRPRLIVMGVGPRDFMATTLSAASATEDFHFFARYVELSAWGPAAFPAPIGRLNWELGERLALRRWSEAYLPCLQSPVSPQPVAAKP